MAATPKARKTWTVMEATAADAPALLRVHRSGWDSARAFELLPTTPTGQAWLEGEFVTNIADPHAHAPLETLLRVVRDEDGSPVSYATYRLVPPGTKPEERSWRARYNSCRDVPDMSEEALDTLFGEQDMAREHLMGSRGFLFLESLATLSTHRGRGIASALVDWGNALADERGLECFLHASKSGLPLYERSGYRVGDVSGLGVEVSAVSMVRPVSAPTG